jgi:hypothetical protein
MICCARNGRFKAAQQSTMVEMQRNSSVWATG